MRHFDHVRRVVVKLGTQVVMEAEGRPALSRLYGLMEGVAALRARGIEVVLVSSGAVGLGGNQLKLAPDSLAEKQACAAVGQGSLMALYQEGFGRLGFPAAQVLLTEEDFEDPLRLANLRRTLETLLGLGALPVINENDAVSTLELERPERGRTIFSDNDHLSALVAAHLGADLLVLLSDVEALFTANPKLSLDAVPIPEVPFGADLDLCTEGVGPRGRGGMASKLSAAQKAAAQGVPVLLASGHAPRVLERLLEGQILGTHFHAVMAKSVEAPHARA